jgi:hypothetical protein
MRRGTAPAGAANARTATVVAASAPPFNARNFRVDSVDVTALIEASFSLDGGSGAEATAERERVASGEASA